LQGIAPYQFEIDAAMFVSEDKDGKKYLKACDKYATGEAKDSPEKLNSLAVTIFQNFGEDAKALKQAEKYAKEAAEKGNTYNFYLTYAEILLVNGKKETALEMANKSLELAVGQRGAETAVKRFIQKTATPCGNKSLYQILTPKYLTSCRY